MQALFVQAGESPGPAPNSGDGVPDGSGFDQDEWINYGGVYAAVVLIGFAILIAIFMKREPYARAESYDSLAETKIDTPLLFGQKYHN